MGSNDIQLTSYDDLEKAEGKPLPRRQSLNNAENDEESQRKSKSQQKLRAINRNEATMCVLYTSPCRSMYKLQEPQRGPQRWGAFVCLNGI